jgi:hypothetical protein
MTTKPEPDALRSSIAEITEGAPVREHPTRIEALRVGYDHTIVVIESEHPIDQYTCGVHAFHLVGDPTYLEVAGYGLGRTFAGAEFMTFALQNRLLTPRQSRALPGDLIFYFQNGVFRHVGRMNTEARVISKWGTGWLYEHGVQEVPLNYGSDIRYFVGLDEEAALNLFIRYAESQGLSFDQLKKQEPLSPGT